MAENLGKYVNTVSTQVRELLMQNKVPSPVQLENYIRQVVNQIQALTKGAPRNIQDQVASAWNGYWNFFANKPQQVVSAQNFLMILESLEEMFPLGGGGSSQGKGGMSGAKGGKGGYSSMPSQQPQQQSFQQKGGQPLIASPQKTQSRGFLGQTGAPMGPGGGGKGGLMMQPDTGMRADAQSFVPGQGFVAAAQGPPEVQRTRRGQAPPISEASKRLPTYDKKDWVIAAIRRNVVTVISGDTGCGKSTLIPQLVCDAEALVPDDKVVVCTQPRRVAAITLAEYVAKDRHQELGDEVGYQIRFINKFSESTRLIYATTAIVLRRLHSEPDLSSIGCLIVDEVHERDVYTDFLLLLIREAMLKGAMPHMKIVLMSATLKAEDFATYFKKVNGDMALKPVHVPGRMFPVEDYYWEDACEWLRYCPPNAKGKGKQKGKKGADDVDEVFNRIASDNTPKGRPGKDRINDYSQKTLEACAAWKEKEVYIDVIEELVHYFHKEQPKGDGAVLVFLPGWGDITKVYIRLFQSGENFKLITLHSLMTPEQQHEAFERAPKGYRKIVLSTNIAEASVTIDDIVYVIDAGVRKERTFDPATAISTLDTQMVTKANAIQRRGRAGRVQEGMVVHLFPSYMFETFDQFPTPAMLSSSMDEVVLQSKVIHGGTNDDIATMLTNSMASPKYEAVTSAVGLLKAMNCLTKSGELTVLGRAVAAIPVQPNVAKFLLIAGAFRCIKPAAVVAAFLSIKSPFQQGVQSDKGKTGKDYFNKGFASDHLTMLQAYVEWRRAVLRGHGDQFCDDQGLSPETLDMAFMMVQQFVSFMVDAGYDGADVNDGDYGEVDPIRKGSDEDCLLRAAMTAGFAPNLAILYRGQRSPYWYLESNEEVSPFRGSANADYQMNGADGDEWMVFSDAMKMGRFNSIMDSSLIFSPFVMLMANGLMIDEKKGEIRFDRWYAYCEKGPWQRELLDLRAQVMPKFKEAIECRDLAAFPRQLTQRIADFCKQVPRSIGLRSLEAVQRNIDEEVTGPSRKYLSIFEWPEDLGEDDEDGDA